MILPEGCFVVSFDTTVKLQNDFTESANKT